MSRRRSLFALNDLPGPSAWPQAQKFHIHFHIRPLLRSLPSSEHYSPSPDLRHFVTRLGSNVRSQREVGEVISGSNGLLIFPQELRTMVLARRKRISYQGQVRGDRPDYYTALFVLLQTRRDSFRGSVQRSMVPASLGRSSSFLFYRHSLWESIERIGGPAKQWCANSIQS